jgi:hypothetical protein
MTKALTLAVALLTAATTLTAKDYKSSFGFTFSAPDAWLIMTKSELASNPVFANADAGLKAKVAAGSVEIFYDKATSDAKFTDYADVKLGIKGAVPKTPDGVAAACTKYTQELAKAAGRTLPVAACEVRSVGTSKAFYVEYQGAVAGTVTMQYQIVRPDGKLLYVTATCKESSLDKFRPDFEAIVKSIRFGAAVAVPSATPSPTPAVQPSPAR